MKKFAGVLGGKNSNDIVQVRIPYAFKLLTQELQTMNVVMRYICE